jgi:hypothetical protein
MVVDRERVTESERRETDDVRMFDVDQTDSVKYGI